MDTGLKSYFLLLAICLSACTGLWAQERIINDTPPATFEGTIHYQISYSGPNSARLASFLPDSMTMMAAGGNLYVRLYNGVADSLVNEYIWLADSDKVFILDHEHQLAYTAPYEHQFKARKATAREGSEANILGHPVLSYAIAGTHDEIAVSEQIYFPIPEASEATGSRPPFLAAGLSTLPLRSVRKGAMTVTTEAVAISETQQEIGLPVGYAVKPFFARKLRHPYFGDTRE